MEIGLIRAIKLKKVKQIFDSGFKIVTNRW